MNFLQKIFGKSVDSKSQPVDTTGAVHSTPKVTVELDTAIPKVCTTSYMTLFRTLPEVFWAVDYIASRIAGAKYIVKRTKDDSVVWGGRKVCDILSRPNCMMGFREFVYTHFVYKLVNGNGYIRAAMSDAAESLPKHKYCSNFWPLPSDKVEAFPPSFKVPMYGVAEEKDLIDHYRINDGLYNSMVKIPQWQVWHDRDGMISSINVGLGYMKSESRLKSLMKPISNLLAVYEARNVIYVKRGGIGFITSQKQDETGSVAMEAAEKKELRDQLDSEYGVTSGKSPIGITDVPISFIRTNLSIGELQPFDETLYDAIEIAGAYGIPAVLVPRKDQSTFSNQSTAEKAVYCGTIIPMARQFCEELSRWLGLDTLYIDCNFDDVDCLQNGRKEAEQVKLLINNRCSSQFMQGLITLNDWRAQINESQLGEEEMPIFSKLRWQMTPEELAEVDKIMLNQFNKTSTEDEDGQRNEKEPGLRDQGE